jgi:FkbM family methyltransferase
MIGGTATIALPRKNNHSWPERSDSATKIVDSRDRDGSGASTIVVLQHMSSQLQATHNSVTGAALLRAAVRKIYPIGSVRAVRRGPLKGLRFKVMPAMGFTYAWGIGVEQWMFNPLIRRGMCVYDVGANYGQSTLSLALSVGASGRVIAFEPVAEIFADLVFNLRLNPSLQVDAICAAVSERNGVSEFLFDGDVASQGRLKGVEPTYMLPNAKAISVRTVRLDDYIGEGWPVPQFIKIDVEGGAGAVLRGAENLIVDHRPTIYAELHGPDEQIAIGELLRDFRYEAQTILGTEVPDPTAGWFNPLVCKPL